MIRLRTHNPGQLTDAELGASFVARQDTYQELLHLIRRQPERGPLQHVILIGERGMGKTTLGLRTLLGVRQDKDLSKLWQPVPFPEESYAVTSLGELWLEALGRLSIATDDPSWAEKAEYWQRNEKDDVRLRALARDALADFRRATGRRLILFIENIDEVLGKFSESELSKLREDLQSRDDMMILGSATQRFERIAERHEAFYEFFRTVHLAGVDAAGARRIVDSMAAALECDALKTASARVDVIRTLTGGNPRLIHLTTRLVAQSPLGSAREDLEKLLDDQTPYFKARIDALPAQQAKLFLALARAWAPATAAELAVPMRQTSSHVSAQLKKLEDSQLIHRVMVPGQKRAHYEVSARLYNLYLVMRGSHDSRKRLEALVRFLADLYGREGLAHMDQEARRRMDGLVEPAERVEHQVMLAVIETERRRLGDPGTSDSRTELDDIYNQLVKSFISDDRQAVECIITELTTRFGATPLNADERKVLAGAYLAYASLLGQAGDVLAARKTYSDLAALAQSYAHERTLREEQAKAAYNLIDDLGNAGDIAGARALYAELVALAGCHDEPALREAQARAAFNLITHLGNAGDIAGAPALYAELAALAGRLDKPALRQRQADAASNLIDDLGNAGDIAGARALYEELVALAGRHDEPVLREAQARAACNLINYLGNAGDIAGARALYAELAALAGRHDEPALRQRQAKAAFNLITHLGNAGDIAGAPALYAELAALAGRHDEPALREAQARAAVNLILTLSPSAQVAEIDPLFRTVVGSGDAGLIRLAITACVAGAASAGNWSLAPFALDHTDHLDERAVPDNGYTVEHPAPWFVYFVQRPPSRVLTAMRRMGVADRVEPVYRLAQEEAGIEVPPLPQEIRDAIDIIRPMVTALRAGTPPETVFGPPPDAGAADRP